MFVRIALLIGGLTIATMPAAPAASPIACASPCTIEASLIKGGFFPAVQDVASGTSVSWFTNEETHKSGEFGSSADPCWNVNVGIGLPSPLVRFDVSNGTLTATVGTTTRQCSSAISAPDGSALVAYYCVLHPMMIGVLRIET